MPQLVKADARDCLPAIAVLLLSLNEVRYLEHDLLFGVPDYHLLLV